MTVHGYANVLLIDDPAEIAAANPPKGKPFLRLTFDDGWHDCRHHHQPRRDDRRHRGRASQAMGRPQRHDRRTERNRMMDLDAPADITFIDRETGAELDIDKPQITVGEAETMLTRLVFDGFAERTRLESGQWRYSLTERGRAAAKRAYDREQREQGL